MASHINALVYYLAFESLGRYLQPSMRIDRFHDDLVAISH